MSFTALTCPQCGAALPRQARWRMVICPYCSATVTRNKSLVQAAPLREAAARVRAQALAGYPSTLPVLRWQGQRYQLLKRVGIGEHAEVHLAEHMGLFPERVIVKLAHAGAKPGVLAAEAEILRALQASPLAEAAYLSQRVPQAIASGVGETAGGNEREGLLLRHPSGYWGSLAQALRYAATGIDPRHAVWIWRRVLEVLAFAHDSGWTHGDLRPEHWLVHPRDHGVLLVGWSHAMPGADGAAIARDLRQSAWTLRALLCGGDALPTCGRGTPPPLVDLLRRSSEDAVWCAEVGARGLDQALVAAARAAFGPPKFIPFNPTSAACR